MLIQKILKTFVVAFSLLSAQLSFAADIDTYADENDVAISGYDAVSYFENDQPLLGSQRFSATYKNGIYLFANANSRDRFKADPEKYAPQFGGYCAMGVVLHKKLPTDPHAFRIVDGKLYLNLNKTVQNKWMEDIPGNISTAEKVWPDIKTLDAKELNES